jgi:hypothetical protein
VFQSQPPPAPISIREVSRSQSPLPTQPGSYTRFQAQYPPTTHPGRQSVGTYQSIGATSRPHDARNHGNLAHPGRQYIKVRTPAHPGRQSIEAIQHAGATVHSVGNVQRSVTTVRSVTLA